MGCGTAARRPRPGFSHLPVGGLNAPPSRVLQQHQYPAMRPTHRQVGDKNGVVVVILRTFLPVAVGPCGRSLPVHSPIVPNCPLPAPLFRCRTVRTQVPAPEWGHPPASGSRGIRCPAKLYHASHRMVFKRMTASNQLAVQDCGSEKKRGKRRGQTAAVARARLPHHQHRHGGMPRQRCSWGIIHTRYRVQCEAACNWNG